MTQVQTDTSLQCTHCGDACTPREARYSGETVFCCEGCETVYHLLQANGLSAYYDLEKFPGLKRDRGTDKEKYAFLEHPEIQKTLIDFDEGEVLKIGLQIPAIHCSSCIWLLENLTRLHPGIRFSRVDFLKKEISVSIDRNKINIRQLVELLAAIGYEPNISLEQAGQKKQKKDENRLMKQIALAGFCFGNIMMFSFPEYFGFGQTADDERFSFVFKTLNFALAVPALLYSGQDYFTSAWKAIKSKVVHINIPLALGMIALFGRSAYEILSGVGAGYMDSLTGLIFFLLVGKWFQEYTYGHINFERDYKSYFPLAVTVVDREELGSKMVSELKKGDRMYIRHGDIVPADAILLSGNAEIDYSFVTGESAPVKKELGEIIYGGGRQIGGAIEAEVVKDLSQSHLTKLWNSGMVSETEGRIKTFSDQVSRYFTFALIGIALLGFAVWSYTDVSKAFFVFTSVLIVACPCALALSSPFALGNMLRIFGRNGLYIKNTRALESMAHINHIVFDKTGTLTESNHYEVHFEGRELSNQEKNVLYSASRQSRHPYSRAVALWCGNAVTTQVQFEEQIGKGIKASAEKTQIRLGSAEWLGIHQPIREKAVYLEINDEIAGVYRIEQVYRPSASETLNELGQDHQMSVISGDDASEMERIKHLYSGFGEIRFKASPEDKLNSIKVLQSQGEHVMMLGDGLNDSGALMQSELGLVLADDVNNFTPSAKGILAADQFSKLPVFFRLSRKTIGVIQVSFVISLMYNIAGLAWALSGNLSPVFAAILMPLSSVTVVGFNTLATHWLAKKEGLS